MGEVADLWASLGARIDARAWAAADARIAQAERSLGGAGRAAKRAAADHAAAAEQASSSWGLVGTAIRGAFAFLGARIGAKALIGFNASAEDARNQIAGMLSLAKKSDFNAELTTADGLMASLAERAASLPGTTAEYVAMLGNIAQPVVDAGLSMKALEDLTVGAVVAAKALGVEAEAGARDIDQALNGQFHSEDRLTGKLLGASGFQGEEGRTKFNALSKAQRAATLQTALTSPQLTAMAEAQGKSFNGILSTLQDALQHFFARVGKPLFEGLGNAIKGVNEWLDKNQEAVAAVADEIGGALRAAFEGVGVAVQFFRDHMELTKSILIAVGVVMTAFAIQAAAAWLAAFWPVALAIAVIAAVVYAIRNFSKTTLAVLAVIFFPITAVVAAIMGVVYAVRHAGEAWTWLKSKAGGVWEAFKSFGERVKSFFTDDIPNAIKSALTAAFDFIRHLPVIEQIIDAIQWTRDKLGQGDVGGAATRGAARLRLEQGLRTAGERLQTGAGMNAPSLAASPSGGNVSIGDVHVSSPNADPKAVAVEVHRTIGAKIDEHMGNKYRRAMDVLT